MVKRRPKTSVIWLFGMRLRWNGKYCIF